MCTDRRLEKQDPWFWAISEKKEHWQYSWKHVHPPHSTAVFEVLCNITNRLGSIIFQQHPIVLLMEPPKKRIPFLGDPSRNNAPGSMLIKGILWCQNLEVVPRGVWHFLPLPFDKSSRSRVPAHDIDPYQIPRTTCKERKHLSSRAGR